MKDTELYTRCEAAKPKFMERWEKLVNIDSGSCCGTGINKISDILVDEFNKLGAITEQIPTTNPEEGSHTLVTFRGTGKGKILAVAHVDTVFPEGTVSQRPFSIEGHSAKGPGVADCKSGVNLLLSAMEMLDAMKYKDYDTITMLFNCDEEIGSPNSRYLIQKLAKEHDFTLVGESGQLGDALASCRRGSNIITVEVRGLSCHAGHVEEPSANALLELTYQMQNISALEDTEKGTNINFTICNCGKKKNIIPDYAKAVADMRVTVAEEVDRVEKAAKKIAKNVTVPGTTVDVIIERNNPPFSENIHTDKLIELAQNIYKEIGKNLNKLVYPGGSSDANWIYQAGCIVADGFGVVKNGKNHTDKESSDIETMVPRLYLLVRMFMELGKLTKEDM